MCMANIVNEDMTHLECTYRFRIRDSVHQTNETVDLKMSFLPKVMLCF